MTTQLDGTHAGTDSGGARSPLQPPAGGYATIPTATRGTNAVDWEQRIDFDRLRSERLARTLQEDRPA